MSRLGRVAVAVLVAAACGDGSGAPTGPEGPQSRAGADDLVVRFLSVGLGDAILITNGDSRIVIDGGPDRALFGRYLDELGFRDTTIDAVILSHVHYDHHSGLRALFESRRGLEVRQFFENRDSHSSGTLRELRDSVQARRGRGELVLRDSDDPCGNGSPICTLELDGGARLHVLRPNPSGSQPNDRSTAVKLVGPDSASFTVWLAGDAEHEQIGWFEGGARYHVNPGMRVHLLKANHHGACDGVTSRYLELTSPEAVIISTGENTRGYVHTQTKDALHRHGVPWYRTDTNGVVTVRVPSAPGSGYRIEVERGRTNTDGPTDRAAGSAVCPGL